MPSLSDGEEPRESSPASDSTLDVRALTTARDTGREGQAAKAGSAAPALTPEQCLFWAHGQLAKLRLCVHPSNLNLTTTQPTHDHNPGLPSKGTGTGRDQGSSLRPQAARERARI